MHNQRDPNKTQPKQQSQQFYFKNTVVQNVPKSHQIFGLLLSENCSPIIFEKLPNLVTPFIVSNPGNREERHRPSQQAVNRLLEWRKTTANQLKSRILVDSLNSEFHKCCLQIGAYVKAGMQRFANLQNYLRIQFKWD